MYQGNDTISVDFGEAEERIQVDVSDLERGMIDFLEHHATEYLTGAEFARVIGEGSGAEKIARLMAAAGFADDPDGFQRELIRRLGELEYGSGKSIRMGGVAFPYLFLMAVLEKVVPGKKFVSIKNVDQLERWTRANVPESDRAAIQEVIDTYPVRLSLHTIRQTRLSREVGYQYMPFVEELDAVGHTNTWIGQFHQGLLEQMYRNRVIFLLNMSCPVYCRFCFRKHKESRNQANPTPADVRRAVDHVAQSPSIKEIVITGGDPFLDRENMRCAIDGLMEIPHVQTLRLATRSVAYYPNLFLGDDEWVLEFLKSRNRAMRLAGKRMELATHFIHPDEVSPESLYIISELARNGIAVYVQTPFLNDCNDQGPELVRLFSLLRGAGAELHYIYIPCSPIHGNSIYWTPLSKGVMVARYLRAHLSDRVIPRICTATPIGKMDWNASGWAVEADSDENFVWLRTPYTPEYYKSFGPLAENLDMLRVNDEGTIDVRYMAKIGDPGLFIGSRPNVTKPEGAKEARTLGVDGLPELREKLLADQALRGGIVPTGVEKCYRPHETRVELDPSADAAALDYIRKDERITDVVIAGAGDALEFLPAIDRIISALASIPHVNAVRLKSLWFNYYPERYTRAVIRHLTSLNRLEVATPLRLEIETAFLRAEEIRPEHRKLAARLLDGGVTTYANSPLLSGVNDAPEAISRLAFALRESGIEFHHLYVAGLPIQKEFNGASPVAVSDVIDIASMVRREGSGREIPRYIIATELGEVDFGLTSRLSDAHGRLKLTLLAYDLGYYQSMAPGYRFPAGVETDAEGRPVVSVEGLADAAGFLMA